MKDMKVCVCVCQETGVFEKRKVYEQEEIKGDLQSWLHCKNAFVARQLICRLDWLTFIMMPDALVHVLTSVVTVTVEQTLYVHSTELIRVVLCQLPFFQIFHALQSVGGSWGGVHLIIFFFCTWSLSASLLLFSDVIIIVFFVVVFF